jgi:hypothetical protein
MNITSRGDSLTQRGRDAEKRFNAKVQRCKGAEKDLTQRRRGAETRFNAKVQRSKDAKGEKREANTDS